MSFLEAGSPLSRRRALKMGAGITASLITASSSKFAFADSDDYGNRTVPSEEAREQIENIIQAEGQVLNGIFQIEIDRDDILDVKLHGVPILPSFQINGTLTFQSLGNGQTMMNADMALKPTEIQQFIHTLIDNNIVLQAEHQHFYDFDPLVWFVHFRGVGDEDMLANGVKAALNKTSTPFPQKLPSNPWTPLPADELGDILGAKPSIGAHGVVNFGIPRNQTIWLGGHKISPYLNVEAPIAFQPLSGGQKAAAVPDFSLVASESNRVIDFMQDNGWDTGCLYNQETDEQPQLYFSHNFKVGDPLQLAREIRAALNMTNSRFM